VHREKKKQHLEVAQRDAEREREQKAETNGFQRPAYVCHVLSTATTASIDCTATDTIVTDATNNLQFKDFMPPKLTEEERKKREERWKRILEEEEQRRVPSPPPAEQVRLF
jgi:hypothetical protein